MDFSMQHQKTQYQKNQIKTINSLEDNLKSNKVDFSIVSAVDDYKNDPRMCLTCAHFPSNSFIESVDKQIIKPLKQTQSSHFYYKSSSFHITITGIQKVSDPKTYSKQDIEKTELLFDKIIPQHKAFNVFFYKLVLLPTNLSLFGTSDQERDNIFLDLNKGLKRIGLPNNNKYLNSKYFFCNMTICRFNEKPSKKFVEKVKERNEILAFDPYKIDSASLIEANASLGMRKNIKKWELKK